MFSGFTRFHILLTQKRWFQVLSTRCFLFRIYSVLRFNVLDDLH